MDKLQKKSAEEITPADQVKKEVTPETLLKKEKKIPMVPPAKLYFTVVVEATAPLTLTYRVLAETPEQALELIKNAPMSVPPKPQLARAKKHKASVYASGTSIIKLTKNY